MSDATISMEGSTSMGTLQHLLALLPGGTPAGDMQTAIRRVHTDTRTLRAGDLFVALHGERFDGNQFLAQAKASGASAALCHAGFGLAATGLPGIEVANSLSALGTLGAAWRAQYALPLIAVTGSNGKTTVTQMLAAILAAYQPAAMLATAGNLNNNIGVPLTLLRLRPEHRIAVVELGMNHPGEIAELAAMACPTVALVNNAQREHLEFMGTVQAVAQENGAVIAALPADGIAVFPHDDAFSGLWRTLAGARRVMTFAVEAKDADVCCASQEWADGAWQLRISTPGGDITPRLRAAGQHNIHNALAATTCAVAAGVPLHNIQQGLETFEAVKGRSRVVSLHHAARNITLVDDSYNANPDSVQAAIALLASLPAPRLMVLGDMGEVGDDGETFHVQAGAAAQALGIESLFTLGTLARAASLQMPGARHFDDVQQLIAAARQAMPHTASVLVKGSRFMKMERVVDALEALQAASTQQHASAQHQSADQKNGEPTTCC